jgi:outer membrane protein, multidrug efflux system
MMDPDFKLIVASALGISALSGCHQVLSPDRVTVPVSTSWTAPLSGKASTNPTAWLAHLESDSLQKVVREAVANNFSLSAAAARLRQAKLRALRTGADRFPEVNLGLRADETRTRSATAETTVARDYGLNLSFAWEADLWGRLRDSTAAANAEATAASADYLGAHLSLAVNTAKAWCDLIETEQQVELALQTLASNRSALASVDSKQRAGVPEVGALDVRLARSSLASAQANEQTRRRTRDEAKRRLETLLGRYPSGVIASGSKLPTLRNNIPVGLPSTLLLRRPDVVAVELRVGAATRNLSAARKALLPSIRLTGSSGNAGPELAELLNGQTLVTRLAAALTQPLFQGGRLRAAVQLSEAERDELAQNYAEVALQAFREVETTLAAEVYLDAQVRALQDFAAESSEAEALAMAQYEKGLGDFLRLLESQRRAFDSRSSLLRAQNQRLQARLDLYLALGGVY